MNIIEKVSRITGWQNFKAEYQADGERFIKLIHNALAEDEAGNRVEIEDSYVKYYIDNADWDYYNGRADKSNLKEIERLLGLRDKIIALFADY